MTNMQSISFIALSFATSLAVLLVAVGNQCGAGCGREDATMSFTADCNLALVLEQSGPDVISLVQLPCGTPDVVTEGD